MFHLALKTIGLDQELKQSGTNVIDQIISMKKEDFQDDQLNEYFEYRYTYNNAIFCIVLFCRKLIAINFVVNLECWDWFLWYL